MDIWEKKHRAVNFDLYTNELKKEPTLKSEIEAYKILKSEFLNFNFTHRQYSGYVSNSPISIEEIYIFVKNLSERYPWLQNSVREFDVTRVEDIYSLKEVIKNPYKNIELIQTPPIKEMNKHSYYYDNPSEFIDNAIHFNFIDISETPNGLELYMDQTLIGIYDSYADIEMDIKECESEIEYAITMLSNTKNKLKEGR